MSFKGKFPQRTKVIDDYPLDQDKRFNYLDCNITYDQHGSVKGRTRMDRIRCYEV